MHLLQGEDLDSNLFGVDQVLAKLDPRAWQE
jgi:hypothetical protein